MDISWALIISCPNWFNLLNLQNHSISQSINRGLGVGDNQSILESKVMLVVYLQSPLVAEESLFQKLGCTLILFTAC